MGVQMCSQLRRRRERGVAGDLFFHWLSSEYWPDIIKNLRRSLTNCRYHLRATLARSSSEASQYSVLPINPPPRQI
uniref:Uncharacterized protein n=1 Tax=Klebsiella pneumoniae TaxID=573 RepID=A0A2P1BPZ4_KLEPN|nr:hypothetical protein [Klebsiella pneumoniae]